MLMNLKASWINITCITFQISVAAGKTQNLKRNQYALKFSSLENASNFSNATLQISYLEVSYPVKNHNIFLKYILQQKKTTKF